MKNSLLPPGGLVSLVILSTILSVAAPAAAQQLVLAAPIADHMVLQQGKRTSIWGTAAPGAAIEVAFAGQTVAAKAGKDGAWEARLKPLKKNMKPRVLTVTAGSESVKVQDVLVGEVWMCSGQSNMGWTLAKSENAEVEIAAADYPHVRLFATPLGTAADPQRDTFGEWKLCAPDSAGSFSAVGYHFGRELAEALGKGTPLGLINTAWGGKPSESFTTRKKLESVPSARPLLAEWDRKQAAFDEPVLRAAYEKALSRWEAAVKKIREEAKAKGEKPGRMPRRPQEPVAPRLNPNFPGSISNSMIEPWTRYAIAGAIWYQGESNQWRAAQYRDIFPAMIEDWRARWGDKFPFYFVQLANFTTPSTAPGTPNQWAELQEAQTLTLQRLPKTGMAIINDIGEAGNVHPKNKKDVGKRLALWALARDYGKGISPYSGPIYESHEISGNKVRVHFQHVGEGLAARDGGKLQRFEIAGADEVFHWADAEISKDGRSVIVASPKVKKPASVRYAWAANPEGANLVNSAGLPASLFRTDDWKMITAGVRTFDESQVKRQVANLGKVHAQLEERGWTVLFNGNNLAGWMNPYDHGEASVVDGEIHLVADKKFFLCTEEVYGDFTFTGEVRLPEGKSNSGFMFRCHVEPNKVYGYQAEVDGSDRRWSGGLYDEGRRGWIWPSTKGRTKVDKFLEHEAESQAHFAKPEVAGALKRNDWNKYEITCRGNSIVIKVNGVLTTRFKDDTDASGHIAIQHHGEDGQVYRFRNLYLRKL